MIKERPYAPLISIIINAAFAGSLWFVSLTIFFPVFGALVLSSWLRKIFFCFIFSRILTKRVPLMSDMQKQLFQMLHEQCVAENPKRKLRILEVGVGPGINFPYYPENCSLTLLDMNENFDVHIKERLKLFPQLEIEKIVFANVEDMRDVESESYDIVVCTHFLCSVSDVKSALMEVQRVLRRAGKFAFLDHIAFPRYHIVYWIQKVLTPIWFVYCNGCCLDRNVPEMIEMYFGESAYNVVYPKIIPLLLRAHAYGLATK